MIKWTEGGRIVHYNLSGKILAVEDYSKASIAKIVKFLNRSNDLQTVRSASFNAAAHNFLNDIESFDIIETNDGFLGVPAKDGTNKITRNKDNRSNHIKHNMYLPVDQNWKMNMRYLVNVCDDGSVEFVEFEEINSENLNKDYSEMLLNVYECEKN
jgi:hypothetical protein